MQVIVDDLLVSYGSSGTGKKPLLLLHGWADSSATFKKLISGLGSGQPVIFLDLAGFGGSQAPLVPWDIPDYANYVAKFINKIGLEPYAVLGHSNGGAIAVNAVANKLIEPKKLILLASSGVRNSDSIRKKLYKVLAKPAKLALSPLPKSAQMRLKKTAYRKIGSDLFEAPHMGETFKKIVKYDIQSEAKNLNLPTLLLYGDMDTITPSSQGHVLAGLIKNSKFEIIQGATHFLHQEQPQFIANRLKDFLK